MLESIFLRVLEMSVTGVCVILAILPARLLLRRAPKVFSYTLWLVVLLRLLCPVGIPLVVSGPEALDLAGQYVPMLPQTVDAGQILSDLPAAGAAAIPWRAVGYLLAHYIWLAGMMVLLAVHLHRYLRLRRKLAAAKPMGEGIFLTDQIGMPFVMGVLHPRIYLPTGLGDRERRFVLAHERCHIRHLDHILKPVFFLAVCLHWFNPLVWLAFRFFVKDMEIRCDEGVLKALGCEIRADYAAALLGFSGKTAPSAVPLAFGEGNVKERILNMAKWKKPKKWTMLAAFLLCVLVMAACAVEADLQPQTLTGGSYTLENYDGIAAPVVTFDPEEKRFHFTYDYLSSNWIAGSYTLEDGRITAVTDNGRQRYIFELVDQKTVRYVHGVDTGLMTVDNKLAVPHGALFRWAEQEILETTDPATDYADASVEMQDIYTHCVPSCTDPDCTDITHYRDIWGEYHKYLCSVFGCTDSDRHRHPDDHH